MLAAEFDRTRDKECLQFGLFFRVEKSIRGGLKLAAFFRNNKIREGKLIYHCIAEGTGDARSRRGKGERFFL